MVLNFYSPFLSTPNTYSFSIYISRRLPCSLGTIISFPKDMIFSPTANNSLPSDFSDEVSRFASVTITTCFLFHFFFFIRATTTDD